LGGRDGQISEFEASLVYRVSSRTAKATQRNLVSKTKKKKKKKKKERKKEKGKKERKEKEKHIMCVIGGSIVLIFLFDNIAFHLWIQASFGVFFIPVQHYSYLYFLFFLLSNTLYFYIRCLNNTRN
jgi:cation transport ATPase